MAQLIVRNVDGDVADALRRRAAASGRSVEAEHRHLLREVLLPAAGFKDFLSTMPDVGDDAGFERARDFGRGIEL